jgi:hypothetical protein
MQIKDLPPKLQPYAYLGVELNYKEGAANTYADCPFCGKEGKLAINTEDGRCRCFVCVKSENESKPTAGMNIHSFMRKLYELAYENTEQAQYEYLAEQRKLCRWQTLRDWGAAINPLTDEWVLPGYDLQGKIKQLYRYHWVKTKKETKAALLATVDGHRLVGLNLFDKNKTGLYVCEGAWDAMALWEVMKFSKEVEGGYELSSDPKKSLLNSANVIAVPGATTFETDWCEAFGDKIVRLCYDSDHPRRTPVGDKIIPPEGTEGMKRVAQCLSGYSPKPKELHYLCWGAEGYDPKHKSGFDVRDFLCMGDDEKKKSLNGRIEQFTFLKKELIKPIPADWIQGRSKKAVMAGNMDVECVPCDKYKTVEDQFKKAVRWSPGWRKTLVAMFSSIISTNTVGEQLWFRVIGPPSCGKTTLCEAISIARDFVVPKSTMRGFHSGYKTDAAGEEDHSLIDTLRDKTFVLKDGDTILKTENLGQILSEARDIYDRASRTHYRHGLKRDYEAINMTWVLCGTTSLRALDTSELGERFLTVVMVRDVDPDLEYQIQLSILDRVSETKAQESKGTSSTSIPPKELKARQLTGGYVNYLRQNAILLLEEVKFPKNMKPPVAKLAKLVAFMRARPSPKQVEQAQKELSYRLTFQLGRFACCAAAVLNKKAVDREIIQLTKEIAFDTCEGVTFNMAQGMYKGKHDVGMDVRGIATVTGLADSEVRRLIKFMLKIGLIETFTTNKANIGNVRYRLTEEVRELIKTCYEIK